MLYPDGGLDNLDDRTRDTFQELKRSIIDTIWDSGVSGVDVQRLDLDAYYHYYQSQWEQANRNNPTYFVLKPDGDIFTIMNALKGNDTIREILKTEQSSWQSSIPDRGSMEAVILAGRLLTMVNVLWNEEDMEEPLRCYLAHIFKRAEHPIDGDVKFRPSFIARNIHESGIRIAWTDDFADHLRLAHDRKSVQIFHHVSFLQRIKDDGLLFPPCLIRNTIESLALLFPRSDGRTRTWFEKQRVLLGDGVLDRQLVECGDLSVVDRNLNHFRYWRDRLEILHEAFDESSPTRATLKILRDRRRGDSWLTSWVAIVAIALTVFFGMVQSIEGAIQVWKAYHPEGGGPK